MQAKKKSKIKYSLLYLLLLPLLSGGIYALFTNQQNSLLAVKIVLTCFFVVLTFFSWLVVRTYRATIKLSDGVLEKNKNVEKLLLDIRDGTKNFYKEKRKSERIKTKGQISAKITNKDMDKLINVLDISYEGALLSAQKEHFRQEEVLNLEMYLPLFPQPIDVRGKVVRIEDATGKKIKNFNAGITYLTMPHQDRKKLAETIDALRSTRHQKQ